MTGLAGMDYVPQPFHSQGGKISKADVKKIGDTDWRPMERPELRREGEEGGYSESTTVLSREQYAALGRVLGVKVDTIWDGKKKEWHAMVNMPASQIMMRLQQLRGQLEQERPGSAERVAPSRGDIAKFVGGARGAHSVSVSRETLLGAGARVPDAQGAHAASSSLKPTAASRDPLATPVSKENLLDYLNNNKILFPKLTPEPIQNISIIDVVQNRDGKSWTVHMLGPRGKSSALVNEVQMIDWVRRVNFDHLQNFLNEHKEIWLDKKDLKDAQYFNIILREERGNYSCIIIRQGKRHEGPLEIRPELMAKWAQQARQR